MVVYGDDAETYGSVRKENMGKKSKLARQYV